MKECLLFIVLLIVNLFVFGQAGSLDSSFGKNGVVETELGNTSLLNNNRGRKVFEKGDGTYVAVIDMEGRTMLAKYTAAGQLNTSFQKKGYSEPVQFAPTDAVKQGDGKIVVCGGNESFQLARFNLDGTIDQSFGSGGKITIQVLSSSDPYFSSSCSAKALTLQDDGKILVAGEAHYYHWTTNFTSVFALARFKADGTPDSTFGINGRLTTELNGDNMPGDEVTATAVKVQKDGKIIVAGVNKAFDEQMIAGGTAFSLIRYKANGLVDSTFGKAGRVFTIFATQQLSYYNRAIVNALELQNDGKIIAAGSAYFTTDSITGGAFALVRYQENGSVDSLFGTGGKVLTLYPFKADNGPYTNTNAFIKAIAVQANGKITAAGMAYTTVSGTLENVFALARYNANGTPDSSFGNTGKVVTKVSSSAGDYNSPVAANAVLVQTDGKIVAIGTAAATSEGSNFYNYALVRYLTNGGLDQSFGSGGRVRDYFRSGSSSFTVALRQSDGKLVAGGPAFVSDGISKGWGFALARYKWDGSLDESFGSGGKLFTFFSSYGVAINTLVQQPDGKILAAGNLLLRYLSDGSPDPEFGSGGILTPAFPIGSIALQSNGKIIAVGSKIARYNSNGSLDNTFGNGGYAEPPFQIDAIGVQADGKFIGCGIYQGGISIVGFQANGAPDSTLGAGGVGATLYGTGCNQPYCTPYADALALQSDGKILVAGHTVGWGRESYAGPFFAAYRYNANGTPDDSFGYLGRTTLGSFVPGTVKNVTVQKDGRILMAGTDGGLVALRLLPNGKPDSTFGVNGRLSTSVGVSINNTLLTPNHLYGTGSTPSNGPLSALAAVWLTNPPSTLTIGPLKDSILCPGTTFQIPYTAKGAFTTGNVFTAQLSSANGDFSTPTNIGSVSSSASGVITVTVPGNILAGTRYRIRVVASLPETIGLDNGKDITIQGLHVYYRDIDGDGFGLENDTLKTCALPDGYAEKSGDCNDQNAAIYPGADGDGCGACTTESVTFYAGKGETYQWQVNEGAGFRNIQDSQVYSGTAKKYLTLTQPPTSWAGYQYRCIITNKGEQSFSPARKLKFVFFWQGGVSTAWENPLNWSCGKVPDEFTDVKVATDVPLILNGNAKVRSLTVSPDAVLIIQKNVKLEVKN